MEEYDGAPSVPKSSPTCLPAKSMKCFAGHRAQAEGETCGGHSQAQPGEGQTKNVDHDVQVPFSRHHEDQGDNRGRHQWYQCRC